MRHEFGEFTLDLDRYELRRGELLIDVQPKALALLQYLIENADRTVPKEELLDRVWPGVTVGEAALTQAIFQVRRALGEKNKGVVVRTVRGRGYRIGIPVKLVEAKPRPLSTPSSSEAGSRGPHRITVPRSTFPKTRYAVSTDGTHIAYQVLGTGPIDLVFMPEWWNHVEEQWEEPLLCKFLLRLASFSRLILFDRRGVGLSDPVSPGDLPSVDRWIEDIQVVMDAVGSPRAALWGQSGGGPLSLLFAATHPDRLAALILSNTGARVTRAEDYPAGVPALMHEGSIDRVRGSWGTGDAVDILAPSRSGDPVFRDWFGRYQRLSASPGMAAAVHKMTLGIDLRSILPSVHVPTLILHRTAAEWFRIDHGRYLAEHIEDARFVEVPGQDHLLYLGDSDLIVDEAERFLTGDLGVVPADRVLTTILCTDVVDSRKRVSELGDRRWRRLLNSHDKVSSRLVERFGGRLIESTGHGLLAAFEAPGRAIHCAVAIREAARPLGVELRAGLHTAEVDIRRDRTDGTPLRLAEQIARRARPREILVSPITRDLLAGSEIHTESVGTHPLRDDDDMWSLFAVDK